MGISLAAKNLFSFVFKQHASMQNKIINIANIHWRSESSIYSVTVIIMQDNGQVTKKLNIIQTWIILFTFITVAMIHRTCTSKSLRLLQYLYCMYMGTEVWQSLYHGSI